MLEEILGPICIKQRKSKHYSHFRGHEQPKSNVKAKEETVNASNWFSHSHFGFLAHRHTFGLNGKALFGHSLTCIWNFIPCRCGTTFLYCQMIYVDAIKWGACSAWIFRACRAVRSRVHSLNWIQDVVRMPESAGEILADTDNCLHSQ